MDFISELKRERDLLQKKIEAIDAVLQSYDTDVINVSDSKTTGKTIKGFPENGSYTEKVIFVIKDANRFLHNNEIADVVSRYDNKDIAKLRRRVSAILSHAKNKINTLVSIKHGNSIKHTFWGSKEWLDDNGNVKKEHMYDLDVIGGEPKKITL